MIFRQNRCKQSLPPHPRRAHYQLNCHQLNCQLPAARLFFFHCDISVIFLTIVLEIAVTVFISLYFQTFWQKWLNFFGYFKMFSVYDWKMTEKTAVRKLRIALGEYSSKTPTLSAASQLKPGTPAARKCLTASRFKRVHQTTNLCLLHPYSSSSELTPGMIPANGKNNKTLLEEEHVPKRYFIGAPFGINVLL